MGLEPRFNCYIGIDYSGAETPESSCRGGSVFTLARAPVHRNRFRHGSVGGFRTLMDSPVPAFGNCCEADSFRKQPLLV
jgi:hypothetical protein